MTVKIRSYAIKYAVLALAFFGALGYLFWSGMNDSMVYYLTLEEYMASPPPLGDGLRLAGWIKDGSVTGAALEGEVYFTVTDGVRELPVRYKGQLPDTFEDGAEVIVEGIFNGHSVFEAASLLAKCPSKYEAAASIGEGQPNE